MELLQIWGYLITYLKDDFIEYEIRKDLINFCWNKIKTEDKITKNLAYIFACKFIVSYGLPFDNVYQVNIFAISTD